MNDTLPPPETRQDSRYSSRKFVLAILVFTTATVLLAYGKIDGATWQAVVTWNVGLYAAGNVGRAAADALSGKT